MVAECDLEQVSSRLVGTLSKGFRQRVGLADALLGDPEVLILDEPTSGLDPRQATEVRSLISSLAGRRTVLLSSHIIGEVEQVCDRVVILAGGKVRLDESRRGWQRRLQDSGSLTIEVADPPADIKKQLRSLPDILSVSGGSGVFQLRCRGDQREGILRAATEAHWRVLELRSDLVSLESVFLESTGEPIEGKDHDG